MTGNDKVATNKEPISGLGLMDSDGSIADNAWGVPDTVWEFSDSISEAAGSIWWLPARFWESYKAAGDLPDVTRARMHVMLATDDAHVCVHLQKRVIQILTTAVVRRTTVSFSPLG